MISLPMPTVSKNVSTIRSKLSPSTKDFFFHCFLYQNTSLPPITHPNLSVNSSSTDNIAFFLLFFKYKKLVVSLFLTNIGVGSCWWNSWMNSGVVWRRVVVIEMCRVLGKERIRGSLGTLVRFGQFDNNWANTMQHLGEEKE